jgi:hypothetical protein
MIVVDRIEGEVAVLEIDGVTVDFPRKALPRGAREGSILLISLGDPSELLEEGRARLARLRKTSPPGDDIDL